MDWNSIADKLSTVDNFEQAAEDGFVEGGKSMVDGLGQLAEGIGKFGIDQGYRDKVFDRASDLATSSVNFASQVLKDPYGTFESIGNGTQNVLDEVSDRYVAARDAAEASGKLAEFYGNMIGRGAFEVGSAVVPIGKLGTLGKAGEAIEDTEKLANLGKTTESATKVASELPERELSSIVACPNFKVTSNGAILKPNPNKTTTVLGRFNTDMDRIINNELKMPKNTDFGPKQGGFNALNVPDDMYKNPTQFWDEINKPFLEKAIQRGDDILMASDPTAASNLFNADGSLTVFGREVEHLYKNGFQYDQITKSMIK